MTTRRHVGEPPTAPSRYDRGKTREGTMRMLLTQIYARAEQHRAEKQLQRRLSENEVADPSVEESPLSLIELIQASGPLFERYGIGAPDDAVYHRHLLSLSINPDPDWRKKIAMLRLDLQPRVPRQRAQLAQFDGNGSTVVATGAMKAGRRTTREFRGSRHQQNASLSSQQRRALLDPVSVRVDHFGDMLQSPESFAFSKEKPSKTLTRPVSPVRRSSLRERRPSTLPRSSDDENAVAPSPFTRYNSVERLLSLQSGVQKTPAGRAMRASINALNDSTEREPSDSDGPASSTRDDVRDGKRRFDAFESALSEAQLLSTTFEQWKSMRDLRRLEKAQKSQDVRMWRTLMSSTAIAAIFRWIVWSLPVQHAVASRAAPRDLFIPAAIIRRVNVTRSNSVSSLSTLNNFARRLLMARIKTFLASWRHQAAAISELRHRIEARQRAEALDGAFQCMLQWRLFTETRKCLVERANWIALRYDRRILREKIAYWREQLHERQREKWAMKAYALKRVASSWKKWSQTILQRRHMREMVATFAQKRAVARWKRYICVQSLNHDRELVADGHFRSRLMLIGWKRLRSHSITKQACQMNVTRCREARARRLQLATLCEWRHVVETAHQMQELASKFVKWQRLRHLRRWFIFWTHWVDIRLEVADKLDGATRARNARLLTKFMGKWQRHHEASLRLDALREKQIRTNARRRLWRRWRRLVAVRLAVLALRRDYDGHTLSKYMKRWRTFTETARVWRAAVSSTKLNRSHRVLAHCWRLLMQNMEIQRSKKHAAARFLQQRRVTSEHVAFRRWSTLVMAAHGHRTREELARVTIRRVYLLRRMWCIWRKGHRLARLGQIAARNLDTYRKAHVFRVWKHFHQRKRGDRKLCSLALQRLGLSRTASSFYRWKAYAVKMHRMLESSRSVAHSSRAASIRRCWRAWRLAYSTTQSQRRQVAKVVNRWKAQRVHSSFHCWKTRWAIHKRHRLVLHKSLLLSNERVLAIHFHAWKKLSKLKAHRSREFADATKCLDEWKLRRVLNCWRGRLTATKTQGSQLRDALAHWRHLGLAAPFRRWIEFCRMRKDQKARFATVAGFFQHGLARTHFSRWKLWRKRVKHSATRVDKARFQIQQLKMRRCVRKMHSRAQLQRRFRGICAQIARSSSCGAVQQSFICWKRFLAARQTQTAQQVAGSEAIELFKLRRSVRCWEKQTRMRRLVQSTLLKATYLSKSTLLQHCVNSWREYVRQRCLRHALQQKALVFQVFSLLPLYFRGWKRYLDQQKHTRTLLLRASRFITRQLEHKAFTAWTAYATAKKRSRLVVSRWQHAAVMRCFNAWTDFLRHQKRLRAKMDDAVHMAGLRRARYTLQYWHQATRVRRILRVLLSQQSGRTTSIVWTCWRRFTHRQRAAKLLVGRLQNQTLIRVFNSWKQRVSFEVAQRTAIRDRFAAMWLADLRGECWSCWKRFTRIRRLVRGLVTEKGLGMTRDVMTSWRCETRRRKWTKQCASAIQNAAALQTKRLCWTEWRVRLRVLSCAKAMRGEIVQRRASESVRWRFDRWREFARIGHCAFQLRRKMQLRLLRVIFRDGFSAFVQAKSRERVLSLQIQETHCAFLRVWLAEEVGNRVACIMSAQQMACERAWHRLLQQIWTAWVSYHAQKVATREQSNWIRQQILQQGDIQVHRTRTMLVRWSRLDLARALRQWHIQAFARRRERRNAVVAMNRWLSTTTSRVFQGWKHMCTSRKKNRLVQAMYGRGVSKRSLTKWKLWLRQRRGKKMRSEKARAHNINALHRLVFASWRLVTSTRRAKRQMVLAAYRATCLRLVSAFMREWKTFTVFSRTRRVQCTVALVFYQERLLRLCVREWKTQVQQIKSLRLQLQANTERLQVLIMCSCFRAWYTWSRRHRKLARILSVLSSRCDVRTSVRVFAAWRGYADARIRHRCLADTFYLLRRHRKGINALKALRSYARHRLLLLEKAQIFKSAIQDTQLSRVFARWVKFAMLSRKTRAATLQYLQGKLLPTYWHAWVEVVRRRRSLNTTARAIAAAWTNISARRAWNALAAYHSYRLTHKSRLARGETYFNMRQLRVTVQFWRSSAEWERNLASLCRSVIARWQMATACRCLLALRHFAGIQRRLKTNAISLSIRSRKQHSLTAWCAWRKLFLVYQAGRRHNIVYYWRKWILWRSGKRSLSLLQYRIHAVVLKSVQRHTFQSWREYVARRKMGKAVMLMSSRFSDSLLVKRMFSSWCAYVSMAQANKVQMRLVIAHMQSRLTRAAFRSLTEYREHRRSHRAAIMRSDMFYSQRVALRVLTAWKEVVLVLVAQRERLHRCIHMMQHAAQAKSFRSWASHSAYRRELRKKMARAIAMRTELRLQTLFFEWHRVSSKGKQRRRAEDFWRVHSSARSFQHWRQFVVLSKVEHMMGSSAKRCLESCFVTWRKRIATSRRVRGFQLETQRKHHLDALMCCFRGWKQWSLVRTRCKRILSRMAKGNHLRFRFLLWKQFSIQRRRLALLVQPVLPVCSLNDDSGRQSVENSSSVTGTDAHIAVLRAQLAVKARFFQQFEFAWDLRSVWRYWRLAFHAVLFHRLRTLQRHFLSWKRFSDRRKHARSVITTLTRSRRHSSVQSVFKGWRDVVRRVKQLQAERQRERQLWTIVNTEMLRREKRKLREHFVAWLALVQDERHLQASADAYHRARLITKVWLAWRHDFHEFISLIRRQHRERQRQVRRHALSRAVKTLRTNQLKRKRVRLVIEHCMNKRNDKLIPRMLSMWHNWTQRQRMGMKHREYVEGERLRRIARSWSAAANQQRRHRAIIYMMTEQRDEQIYTRVWTVWKRFVKRKRHSQRLIESAIMFRIGFLLRSRWIKRTLSSTVHRQRFELVARQLAVARVRRATRKWRSVVEHQALRRLYRRFVQRKFLLQWRAIAKLALATRFHDWTCRLMAKRMLVEWRSTARRLALWRRLSASISSSKVVNTRRRVWRKWLAFVGMRRRAHAADEFNAHRLSCRCLHAWCGAVQGLAEEREKRLQVTVEQLEAGTRRRVMAYWRAVTQRSKQRRFVVLACVFKLDGLRQRRVLQTVMAAWRRYARLAYECHCAAEKRETRALRGALRCWQAWVSARQARRQEEIGAERYYAQRLVSAAFFYWQNYALAWREVDAGASPPHSAVARSGLSRLTVGDAVTAPVCKLDDADSDADEQDCRRPMSPVMKRLTKKREAMKASNIGRAATKAGSTVIAVAEVVSGVDAANEEGSSGGGGGTCADSVTPTLADAAELSTGVQKRLKVLGPWHAKR